jgi:hypothetical protein
VHHAVNFLFLEHAGNQRDIPKVADDKVKSSDGLPVPFGQVVQDRDVMPRAHKLPGNMRANVPGPPTKR